jgi:hypothetical protein
LGEFNHVSIVVELLCEVDLFIRCILLLAWTSGNKKGGE